MTAVLFAPPSAPPMRPRLRSRRHPAHRDPRPLWGEPPPVASAWASPGFYVAWLIVLPLAALVAPARAVARWRPEGLR